MEEKIYACTIPNYANDFNLLPEETETAAVSARQSAFRAVKTENQLLENTVTYTQITFENEVFEYDCVYNTETSTFRPGSCGLYIVNATVAFTQNNALDNVVYIMVSLNDGVTGVQFASALMSGNQTNFVDISAILKLSPNDRVRIYCRPTLPGTVLPEYSVFSAVKCPFTNNTLS